MTWTTNKVEEAGAMEEVISLLLVNWMFAVVVGEFSEGEHIWQKKWNMLVSVLHTSRQNAVSNFYSLLINIVVTL